MEISILRKCLCRSKRKFPYCRDRSRIIWSPYVQGDSVSHVLSRTRLECIYSRGGAKAVTRAVGMKILAEKNSGRYLRVSARIPYCFKGRATTRAYQRSHAVKSCRRRDPPIDLCDSHESENVQLCVCVCGNTTTSSASHFRHRHDYYMKCKIFPRKERRGLQRAREIVVRAGA